MRWAGGGRCEGGIGDALLGEGECREACLGCSTNTRIGSGRRRGRVLAGAHVHIQSHGRPRGGAEASRKAIGRHWPPGKDRPTIKAGSQQCRGVLSYYSM